jgi:molybdenum cofactor cytidylyltransferase
MGDILAIVLAGGESKRMGFPKMLLKINGRTMLEVVICNIADSDVNNTLVILGAEQESLNEILDRMSVNSRYNDNYKEGMLSSVKCGFSNIPSTTDAVMVFQGDQPLISPKTINRVIDAYRLYGKSINIPVFENKRGHPILIDNKFSEEVMNLKNHEGLRSLAYKFPESVLEVETEDPGILKDIDTWEEFMEIHQIH